MRKVRDHQRRAEKENDASQGGAGGFKGPDGSGQWVSLGELDPNEDLDQALNSLTGGSCIFFSQSCLNVVWAGYSLKGLITSTSFYRLCTGTVETLIQFT